MKKYIAYIGLILAFSACNEAIDYGLDGDLPATPDFSIEAVPDDPNRFVVTDLSAGNFSRVWNFGVGDPATSILQSDTVFYKKAGDYDIELHVASETGGGTAFNTKVVNVEKDVEGCQLLFLNEDCSMKCWRLSPEPESIILGPDPLSTEWFVSPDITPSQADDRWCFSEDGTIEYQNNGGSFSACAGYVDVEDYEIPEELTYTFASGGGVLGLDRITFSDLWMGIEDSGITYDIYEISEEKMVLITPLRPCDGSPSTGYFTLTFLKAE